MTTTTPFWFGPDERPLLGFFHMPASGRATAGAVICPTLGLKAMASHYTLRLLAERLAEQGICTLRFDYDGTGDSAGDARDGDRVSAWLGSIAAAIETVRAAGVASVTLIGLRIGATLAGVAAERDGALDGLVLWDPAESGRAYLAEQRALSALSFQKRTNRDDGAVEGPGILFDATTARELRSVDLLGTAGPLAGRVLVLTRRDREAGRLAERLDAAHVEWAEATGQAELMDVAPPNQAIPYEAIERIAAWTASLPTASGAPQPLHPPTVAGPAAVARTADGAAVVETPAYVGPAGLFGVWTDVPGRTSGPIVLFLNVANEPGIGPARLWVELARQWASAGIRSFRLDLSGLGDSPTRHPGQRHFVTRAPEAFDDVIDAARALCPDDPSDVVLVGLCSSAYQALDSAFDVRPRGVVAINPVLSFRPPELLTDGSPHPRRHAALPRRSAIQAFHGAGRGRLPRLKRRFPRWNTRARDLSETIESLVAAPRNRPMVWLRELADMGVEVLLVCGEREARPVLVSGRKRSFRALERTGSFHLELLPGLEHGLLIADQRDDVAALVSRHVARITGKDAFAGGQPTDLGAALVEGSVMPRSG